MSTSRKYGKNGKTYHVTFSPGTDSSDRKNWDFWSNIVDGVKDGQYSDDKIFKEVLPQPPISEIVETEKLDGQGNCFNEFGLFARSHGAPSENPWDRTLRQKWDLIKNDLKSFGIEFFGENMYAVHSIEYLKLEHDFYCFAIRKKDKWLSWEEVEYFSELFDFPTVPVIKKFNVENTWSSVEDCKKDVEKECEKPSEFGSIDFFSKEYCTKEGVVFRNAKEYHVNNFVQNVFKWVRPGHVKTDVHWTKNWRPAFKRHELESFYGSSEMSLHQYRDAIIGLEKKQKNYK